jgi:polyisoprenoid-binding protein YceI
MYRRRQNRSSPTCGFQAGTRSKISEVESARAGFLATTRINRQDFGVSWQAALDRGGIVVRNEIDIVIDVEAVLEDT